MTTSWSFPGIFTGGDEFTVTGPDRNGVITLIRDGEEILVQGEAIN